MNDELKKLLFPHDNVREIQKDLIEEVYNAIKTGKSLIAHAPTGLGKTASSLPMALSFALENDMTVFFLTSRHTQHKIAIDTLKEIKQKHKVSAKVVDIIGKKWMCPVPGADLIPDFFNYCKAVREDEKCEFYNNTLNKSKLTVNGKRVVEEISKLGPVDSEKIISLCKEHKVCPYEIVLKLAANADVIIADYYYLFNPGIQETFFAKTGNKLENTIVIVDEAHNLPLRVRDLMTDKLSTYILSRAISEAKKYSYNETASILQQIMDKLLDFTAELNVGSEVLVRKDRVVDVIEEVDDYDKIIKDLDLIADDIREKQRQSFIGSVSQFLKSWLGEDKGFTRIISKIETRHGEMLTLYYRCLDPSLVSSPVFDQTYSNILMSGTLVPTKMYHDVLGFNESIQKSFDNPFPDENKLALVVPETTTKYTARGEDQFKRQAEICADIVNAVPGNSAIFFPSYFLRDQVRKYFMTLCNKTIFEEVPNLSKSSKLELLDKFKEYKKAGAVLLGVASGSFGEGIDLPGDLLKCVIVVGLPLQKPDLETKQLIQYFDHKFAKGWDYGYLFPAFNRCLQSAGRCIRSETDRGVVVFLDERFTWPNYFRCFPEDWKLKITKDFKKEVEDFF